MHALVCELIAPAETCPYRIGLAPTNNKTKCMVSWRDQNRVFSIVKMIYTLTKAETSPDCNVRGWDKIPKFCPFEIYCSNGLNYFRKILIKKYGPFLAAGAI